MNEAFDSRPEDSRGRDAANSQEVVLILAAGTDVQRSTVSKQLFACLEAHSDRWKKQTRTFLPSFCSARILNRMT